MKLPAYLRHLDELERMLAASYRVASSGYTAEADVHSLLQTLAKQSDTHRHNLQPLLHRYDDGNDIDEVRKWDGLHKVRSGPLALLLDLQDLYAHAGYVSVTWTLVEQAALASRDHDLCKLAAGAVADTIQQLTWMSTRMKQAGPQALLVAE